MIYAFRFTDLMVQSMHPRQQFDEKDDIFPIRLRFVVSVCFSLRRIDSSINRTDSTMDTTSEPRATEPRL